MRITMNQWYPIRMRYLDSGNTTNFTSPYTASPPGVASRPSKSNTVSPAVVAVIGVLAGAFLIISYYRIFLKYCNNHQFTLWGTRSDARNGGPSTIVLMEEHAWPPDASGLDESLISRIPTCKYNADEGIVDGTECSVCLGEFEEGEELRILPKCNHPFHIPCIDTWLAMSSTCPLCRVNIVLAAAVPYALVPVEREPPAGPTMSFIPAPNTNPMQTLTNHEIEILQEQHVQDFLEAGQLSGPSRSPSLPSSRGSFHSAPDVGTPDHQQIEMQASVTQHMRHLSLEISPTPTREIHAVENDPNVQPVVRSVSQELNRQVPVSRTKQRFYSRARSSGNHKGKHPLLPLSPPQMKRFAPLLAQSSTSSRFTGSSSMNQVVVELLAQEIFQNNVGTTHGTIHGTTDILETRVRRSMSGKASTSGTGGLNSSRRDPWIRHDNSSVELMWSIDEQENHLMWQESSLMIGPSPRASGDSGDGMEELRDAMQLGSNNLGSDSEDVPCERSGESLKRVMSSSSSFETWSSRQHMFKHSMARLKRYGSVSFRQNSFRRSDKVHASEPVFEVFEVD